MSAAKLSDRNHLYRRPFPRRKRLPARPRVLIGALLMLLSAASLILPADLTGAQSPGGSSGSRESEVSLPKALGEARSVRVASALGFVSESIPIVVPPGRRNIQPQLTLAYVSGAGMGDIGLGWGLDLGQVARWRGDGTPTVADGEMFSYSLAGTGAQLLLTDDGVYRARVESVYREFRRLGDQPDDGWEMQMGEGILHRFGGSPESRIEDDGGRGQVWLLDLVRDQSGNTICYFYDRVNGSLYPKEIRYTGFAPDIENACQAGGDLGANRVVFDYEDRPDKRISYANTVREERTRRLQTISVFAGELLVRRYGFEYEPSLLNRQSLLRRIVLVGADDESQIVLRTLEYATREVGWYGEPVAGTVPLSLVSDGLESGVRIIDVNGDARADVVGNGQDVYLGDGQGNFAYDAQWSESLAAAGVRFIQPDGDRMGADTGVKLLDVNSDGRPDLLIAQTNRREVWINTGLGWSLDAQWTLNLAALRPSAAVDPSYAQLTAPDLAAEEIVDLPSLAALLWEHSDGVSQFLWDGFAEATRQRLDDYINETDPGQKELLADELLAALLGELNSAINGDLIYEEERFAGVVLSDATALLLAQSPEGEWLHRLNRLLLEDAYPTELARRFVPPVYGQLEENYAGEPLAFVDGDGVSKGVELADINADGRVDILWAMNRSDKLYWGRQEIPIVLRAVFLNNGHGWVRNSTLTQELADFTFVQDGQLQAYSVMDVNGDGLADMVRTSEGLQDVHLGTGSGWIEEPCDPPGQCYSHSLVDNGIVSLKKVDDVVKGQGLTPLDFDDDGLVDYLRANETVTQAYHNTGTGWEVSPDMAAVLATLGVAFNTADGDATGLTLADVDGDGLTDLIRATDEEKQIWLSASLRAGLLVRATSALGEITELTWAASTSFNNQREDGVEGLPTAMPVPTNLARHDGRGNLYETSYSYQGGLLEDRQFRGFAWSQELRPVGFRKETWYYQEDGLVGMLKVEEGRDTQNQLRVRQTSIYEKVGAWPLGCQIDVDCHVTQVRLVESDVQVLDPPDASWQSHVEYIHDERLRAVQVRRDPDLGLVGDETITIYSWAQNEAAGIWALSARIQTLGPGGALVSESITLYDSLPEGQAGHGLPSEAQDLVESGYHVTKQMAYDQYGNLIGVTDRNSYDTTFDYGDPTHTFRTRAVDPEGRAVWSEYDPRFGQLVRDVDMGGNITTKEYDAFGRLQRVTLPGDEQSPYGTATYTYSPLGDATAQWYRVAATENPGQPGTLDTTSFFDAFGLIYRTEREGAGGRMVVALAEFDDAGNVVATSRPFFCDESPVWSTIERDELHRPTRFVEADGVPIVLSYAGHRVDVVDRSGSPSTFFLNADGQIAETQQWVDGVEHITRYHYDVLGNLTSITDALGEETRLAFDALGRRVRLEDPNAGAFDYRYDGEGCLLEQTGPDGQITRFIYSRAGDLLRKEFPDGTVHEFTYDSAGNVVRVSDAAGVLEIAYDGRGRVIERRRTVLGRTYVTGYVYDSLDQIRHVTYPDGFTVNLEYDAGGNLVRLTDGQGRLVGESTAYTASGQLMGFDFGNGDHSSFTYDELLRMTSIRTVSGEGKVLQSLDYAYDPGSNILSITDLAFGASQSLQYDAIGRLTRAVGAYGEEIYEYDAIGNLLRKGDLIFTVDPEHPQRVINATKVGQAGFELAYDERGNVVEKGSQRLEYDSENHLVRVLEATGKARGRMLEENVYDAGAQRVIQRTPDDTIVFIDGIYEEGTTHASRHVWAGPLLVATVVTPRASVRLISDIPAGGLVGYLGAMGGGNPASIALTGLAGAALVLVPTTAWVQLSAILLNLSRTVGWRRWGKAAVSLLIVVTMLCTMTPPAAAQQASQAQPHSEKRYYYHSNHLGSTNVVTDDRGKVILRRDYKPYGEPFNWTGPESGPRELLQTFDGQRYDDATELYYFGARHYDPVLGRFLTADTEVPDPTDPKALHRYAFAGGNPIRYSDPTGHGFWDFMGSLVGGIIIVVALIYCGIVALLGLVSLGFVAAGLIIGLALLGAAAFGIWALCRGFTPADTEFWLSVVGGALVGAAVGAAIAFLPYALGVKGTLASGKAAAALLGAIFIGLETTVVHIRNGGGPEELLGELLSVKSLVSMAIGAFVGGLLYSQMASGNWMATIKRVLKSVAYVSLQGYRLAYAIDEGSRLFSDLGKAAWDILTFWNSPAKPVGVPAWVFGGTCFGAGPDPRASGMAPLLQTMPLAP